MTFIHNIPSFQEKRRIKEMLKNMDDDSDSYYDRTDRRDKVPTSSTKSKTLAVKAETFESLSVKHIDIFKRISVLEVEIESAPKDLDVLLDLDDLDQYVKQLQRNVEKQKISNLKSSLTGLRQVKLPFLYPMDGIGLSCQLNFLCIYRNCRMWTDS